MSDRISLWLWFRWRNLLERLGIKPLTMTEALKRCYSPRRLARAHNDKWDGLFQVMNTTPRLKPFKPIYFSVKHYE